MTDQKQFDERVEQLEQALQDKIGVRGKSLKVRLKKAGRTLPKHLRAQGRVLTDAQDKRGHPKLAAQIDGARVQKAFDAFETHLKALNPAELRKGRLLNWLASLVLNLIIVAAIFLALLRWQGLI